MKAEQDEVSLKDLLLKIINVVRYLLSKWVVFLIFGIIGGGLGIVYAVLQKPVYTGGLTFVLSNDSKPSGGLASLAGQFGLDMGALSGGNGAFEGENIIELLKSRRIIKGAIFKTVPEANETLINIIGEKGPFFKKWAKDKYLQQFIPFPRSADSVNGVQDSLVTVIHTYIVKQYLTINKPDKKLSFYQVTTNSPVEAVSIHLTKNVVDEAAKMYIETKTKTAHDNLAMLQHEADSLREKLGGAIYSSANKVDETFNLNPALQVRRAPIQQGQVQTQVLGTAYGEVVKNLEIAKITLQKEMPLYQVIDAPSQPLVKVKTSKAKTGAIGILLALVLTAGYLLMRRMFTIDTKETI
ncbi:lipopolysaccharide biosynthesis protein [Deminuibacter soli]|uniref:Lipopolysaccharide biosynthesis protein n=1 Tax=Deminuibacter soli TaxID=2291815 RepID=A0A3E1NFC7_9BACT|nr:lipopolysaccharide biosynthesis protein [Deminuibacter soli]RFM26669.1 lipopolysaccharide biosynthesis protein [Deminuibacter soli]